MSTSIINDVGDMNTCPICYEDIDVEKGDMIQLQCAHKMHPECYANFMSYHVNEYSRRVSELAHRGGGNGVEVLCPFCRKQVVRFDSADATSSNLVLIPLSGEIVTGTSNMIMERYDVESGGRLVEVFAIEPRHASVVAPGSGTVSTRIWLGVCACALLWMMWYLHRLALIYDGDGITMGFGYEDMLDDV